IGADAAKIDALEKAIDVSPEAHFHCKLHVDNCRTTFQDLSSSLVPWPFLRYVGGDGQQADETGNLDQDLQVSVFKANEPVPDATVEFRITPGDDGTLNGAASPQQVRTDEHGIATCKWKLAATAQQGHPPRPERQHVEAKLIDPTNAEASI